MTAEQIEEIERTLAHFSGSEPIRYGNIIITDGVKYLAESCGAFWLIDIVASIQCLRHVRAEDFLSIKLIRTGSMANFIATDGGKYGNEEKTVYRQFIQYTDFPLKEVKLFFRDRTLMLLSEY